MGVNNMAKRITSKAIGKAIKEATGINHIGVWNAGGYHRFFSDDETVCEFLPLVCEFDSVYVYRMNHLSIEQWLDDFKRNLHDHVKPERISVLVNLQKQENEK
jgi:hypothetical protein